MLGKSSRETKGSFVWCLLTEKEGRCIKDCYSTCNIGRTMRIGRYQFFKLLSSEDKEQFHGLGAVTRPHKRTLHEPGEGIPT